MKPYILCIVTAISIQIAVARKLEKINLYYNGLTTQYRTVVMTANVLMINMNLKYNVKNGFLSPEFLKLEPCDELVVMTHNDLMLCEGLAMITYLANSQNGGKKIYPTDPKERALVDQMLYFDLGTIQARFMDVYNSMLVYGKREIEEEKKAKLDEGMSILESYLARNKWAAGDLMTIADIALVTSVSTLEALRYNMTTFPKITAWHENAKKLIPDYEGINRAALDWYTSVYDSVTELHRMKRAKREIIIY